MNFDNITTVSDLVEENTKESTPLEVTMKSCCHLGYDDTLTVVRWLVNNMRDYHFEMIGKVMDKGDCDSLPNWVIDGTRLEECLNLLKKID